MLVNNYLTVLYYATVVLEMAIAILATWKKLSDW